MFRIETIPSRNILILRLKARFNCEDGAQLYTKLQPVMRELKPGFKLMTDMTELEHMEFDAHRSIDNVMELCNEYGVSKVVRVITNESNDIGFTIMSLFHYSHSVVIHTCRSLEEAEKTLL